MSTTISPTLGNSSPPTTQLANPSSQLNTTDFINMMLTQLQNQDPMNPDQSSELLSQMSEIGQLQASTQLQSTLSTMMLQSQISSAGNMIGKQVTGLDDSNNNVTGVVNSVQVVDGSVALQLDTGSTLQLSKVTSVTNATAPAGSATGTAPAPQGVVSQLLSAIL